jgi:hypothetical protein
VFSNGSTENTAMSSTVSAWGGGSAAAMPSALVAQTPTLVSPQTSASRALQTVLPQLSGVVRSGAVPLRGLEALPASAALLAPGRFVPEAAAAARNGAALKVLEQALPAAASAQLAGMSPPQRIAVGNAALVLLAQHQNERLSLSELQAALQHLLQAGATLQLTPAGASQQRLPLQAVRQPLPLMPRATTDEPAKFKPSREDILRALPGINPDTELGSEVLETIEKRGWSRDTWERFKQGKGDFTAAQLKAALANTQGAGGGGNGGRPLAIAASAGDWPPRMDDMPDDVLEQLLAVNRDSGEALDFWDVNRPLASLTQALEQASPEQARQILRDLASSAPDFYRWAVSSGSLQRMLTPLPASERQAVEQHLRQLSVLLNWEGATPTSRPGIQPNFPLEAAFHAEPRLALQVEEAMADGWRFGWSAPDATGAAMPDVQVDPAQRRVLLSTRLSFPSAPTEAVIRALASGLDQSRSHDMTTRAQHTASLALQAYAQGRLPTFDVSSDEGAMARALYDVQRVSTAENSPSALQSLLLSKALEDVSSSAQLTTRATTWQSSEAQADDAATFSVVDGDRERLDQLLADPQGRQRFAMNIGLSPRDAAIRARLVAQLPTRDDLSRQWTELEAQ